MCDVGFVSDRSWEVMAMLIRTRKSGVALGVKFFVLLTVTVLYVLLPRQPKNFGQDEFEEERGELIFLEVK